MSNQPETTGAEGFAGARECFRLILGWLDGEASSGLEHAELERQLHVEGRELLRLLLQDHVDLRAVRESRVEVRGADGSGRTHVETSHTRGLGTIFGEVTVTRIAYRQPGQTNLHPADAALNLPVEKHSHGLRQLAAIESSRGSFDGTVEAIEPAPANAWASDRSKTSPAGRPSTSTPSTPNENRRAATPTTSWCCPATAKAS